ncbi:sulfur carrier protein ThiS [Noviherbaspirillum saxi]|uniref:Sulfur carrier protein ThiS n=1 Tax=Noviherbaspirillum saxi TaxID=2320863 RepID=A0A3A3FJI2_9BURK|nr:sulfur carrier protein ThiS [Noviherbaspirillum saxi]RJF95658.1 sulfur carrier protein ThiS [Noviherbaspirillum saxi]
MEINLNGKAHPVTAPCSVQDLVTSIGLQGKGLAVAINRHIVPRYQWQQHLLQPRDRVEIVHAIGGG